MANRYDRDRLRHPMDGRDVRQLRRVTVFGQIANDDIDLAREKCIRIRERQQQRLDVDILGCRLARIGAARHLMQVARTREYINRVQIAPRLLRNRRIRVIAVDKHARARLQRSPHERGHQPRSTERDALLGFAFEQAFVGVRQLGCKRDARTSGILRVVPERLRRAHEFAVERRPQRLRGLPVLRDELEAARVADRDAIDRRERVADQSRRGLGVALTRVFQPCRYASGTRFGLAIVIGFQRWEGEAELHRGRNGDATHILQGRRS